MAALHELDEPELALLDADPATPDWVKALIHDLLRRDPVDAVAALEVFSAAMSARTNRLLGPAPN